MNFDVSTIKVWEVEEQNGIDFSLLHFPAICLGFWKIFLQRPTIALLLHRISHVTHCVYILTKALLLFTLLLKMAYVELMVGKWKHALVSHISQNQTMDPWRWQIKHVDQDCAHVWKVDGGNGILLFKNLSPFYLDNMRTWQYDYFFHSFFHGHWCVHFFWVMLLGHAIFSLSFF